MKKYLSFVFALGLIASMTSCSVSETSRKSIVSVESSDAEKATKEIKEESETESDTEKDTKSEEKADNSGNSDTEDFTIDEQVLWETEGVKITAKGVETDSLFGTSINVLAENNSDKDVVITTDAVIVNDYMISELGYIEVTAGNKANDEIELSTSDLKAAGIDNIGKIELYLHTYDPETYDILNESGCITIKTSDYESTDDENNISGMTLLDQDGVKIIAQYVDENSFWGTSVLMYVENNTDKNLIIEGDDFSVNGFMVSADYYEHVYAGKKCISPLDIYSSSLEENGIESVDQIEMTIHVLTDDDNYTHLIDTDKITFTTK